MNTFRMVVARAQTHQDRSDAIIVSFNSNCYQSLHEKSFSLIIRKRIPISMKPRWLYFHLNSPISSICARAKIIRIEQQSLMHVLKRIAKIGLPKDEIKSYVGNAESVGIYVISDIEITPVEVTIAQLKRKLNYSPPQSFLVLSVEGKKIVDHMCGYGAV